ncbi:T-cell surface glycoprotein CD3 zeta chain isoform X1 [Gopherus evgoodei]|uniref:T-cell surface glycoprotein CD3 zeta chain isoform X1 n=1 Tax=Gopherus evgoodei TaxID=1825980 RepID=UPI0011CFAD1E|nr:T-cell surface glycoprotein CD3 zeta chain isoform X1 [Gopherus evgoodei]
MLTSKLLLGFNVNISIGMNGSSSCLKAMVSGWLLVQEDGMLYQFTLYSDAAPVPGLTDPRLCYILDGILFIYAVIITALFLKAKFSNTPETPALQGQNDVYNKLSRTTRDEYDVLGTKKRGSDLEMGGRNQQRRKKSSQDTVYTSLQKDKMGEAYSEIGKKGEHQRRRGKGNDAVYQGLSSATKDTYDALQMQPLPPH